MSLVINSSSMTSPITSGYFELQDRDINDMVEDILNLLNRFINSNAEVSLDDSFTTYFRVYSLGHTHRIRRRHRMRLVGCSGTMVFPGTLQVNVGFPKNPQAFSSACFLSSIVLWQMRILANESDSGAEKELITLMKICKGEKKIFAYRSGKNNPPSECWENIHSNTLNLAGELMLKKLAHFSKACNICFTEQIDLHESISKIADHFKCQIHLVQGFAAETASILSYPDEFDSSRPQIVLENLIGNHVTLVTNLNQFFRHFDRELCFVCRKTFSIGYRHWCTMKNCLSCRLPLKTEKTIKQLDPFFKFCDSQIVKENRLRIPRTCSICNTILYSELCQKYHSSLCGLKGQGRSGYFCPLCKNFFKLGFENALVAKANHACNRNTKNCRLCKSPQLSNHQCLVKPTSHTTSIPKLAFFVFSFQSSENCTDCFLLRDNFRIEKNISWKELNLSKNFLSLVCNNHKLSSNLDSKPNAAVILSEVSAGKFERTILFGDDLNPDYQGIKSTENFDYIPFEFTSAFSTKTKNEKLKREIELIISLLNEKKFKSVQEKFLLEIIQPKYKNTTFLSFNADKLHNQVILNSFAELNLIPFVIQDSGKVKMISFRTLKIRFYNASSFLEGTLEDRISQFSLD